MALHTIALLTMTLLNQVNKLLVTPCIVAMEWSCFGISVSRPRLAALLAIAAGVGVASVNTPMCSSLQPYVLQPATLCAPACNPMCSSLQPLHAPA